MIKAYLTIVICVLTHSYLSVNCLKKKDFDAKYKKNGQTYWSEYILGHNLEMQGSFGGVFRIEMDHKDYVVKTPLVKTDEELQDFKKEIENLSDLGQIGLGPYLKDCYEDGKDIFAIMDSLPCSLQQLSGNVSSGKKESISQDELDNMEEIPTRPNTCGRRFNELLPGVQYLYIVQMIETLDEIHNRGSVHNDIKPDNIAITKNGIGVKYIDFGVMEDEKEFTVAGTALFMHPFKLLFRTYYYANDQQKLEEVKERIKKLDNRKVDIWSLGITIYLLLNPESKLNILQRDFKPAKINDAIKKVIDTIHKEKLSLFDQNYHETTNDIITEVVRSMVDSKDDYNVADLKTVMTKLKQIQKDNHQQLLIEKCVHLSKSGSETNQGKFSRGVFEGGFRCKENRISVGKIAREKSRRFRKNS